VSDVVPTLGRREERERGSSERSDVVEGARSRGTQERFQFRERHLDRIEVRTVGRQKSDLRAGGFDGRAHLWLFVDGEIVEHDDIASSECRGQHLLHVGKKAGVVDWPIEHGWRRQPVRPQRGDDRVRFPMAAGSMIAPAHAAATAPVAAQQIGRDAAFIEKDVLPGVAQRQPVAPAAPLSDDVGAPLFVGVYRFF
jgi:hypothetical protein